MNEPTTQRFQQTHSYLRLLPEHLHGDAKGFLQLLEKLPKQLPSACPYCASSNFKVKQGRYCVCKACERGFSALTGTPLYRLQGSGRFRAFAEVWLAGARTNELGKRLKMDDTSAQTWVKRFLSLMQQTHPDLHTWWSAHVYRQAYEPPAHIEERAEHFLQWLERFPHEPSQRCPHCGSVNLTAHSRSGRLPSWRCQQCKRLHNRLAGTPLKGMTHMELWLPYVKLMLQGYGHQECIQQLGHEGLGKGKNLLWRKRFLALIEEREPALCEWIDWQHTRRRGQISAGVQTQLRQLRSEKRGQALSASVLN